MNNKPIIILITVLASVLGALVAFFLAPVAVWLVDNHYFINIPSLIIAAIVFAFIPYFLFKKKNIWISVLVPVFVFLTIFGIRSSYFDGSYGKCICNTYRSGTYNMFGVFKFWGQPIVAYDTDGSKVLVQINDCHEREADEYSYEGTVYNEWGNFLYSLPIMVYDDKKNGKKRYLKQFGLSY